MCSLRSMPIADRTAQGLGHSRDLFRFQRAVERQGHCRTRHGLRDGKHALGEAETAEMRLEMQRRKVVAAGNALRSEFREDGVSSDAINPVSRTT